MSYAVHYRDADGVVHLEDVGSQDEALQLVERLRNQEGPTDLRVFDEVPIEVRTYYKVVAVAPTPPVASTEAGAPTSDEPTSADAQAEAQADVPADAPADPLADLGITEPIARDEPTTVGSTHDGSTIDGTSDDELPVGVPTPPSPFGAHDAPSGAVVMSPPLVHPERSENDPDDPATTVAEPRRQLFSRG